MSAHSEMVFMGSGVEVIAHPIVQVILHNFGQNRAPKTRSFAENSMAEGNLTNPRAGIARAGVTPGLPMKTISEHGLASNGGGHG